MVPGGRRRLQSGEARSR